MQQCPASHSVQSDLDNNEQQEEKSAVVFSRNYSHSIIDKMCVIKVQ